MFLIVNELGQAYPVITPFWALAVQIRDAQNTRDDNFPSYHPAKRFCSIWRIVWID